MTYYIKETENVERIEKDMGCQLAGTRFTILKDDGKKVFGSAHVHFMSFSTLPSLPFWLDKSDLIFVDTGMSLF